MDSIIFDVDGTLWDSADSVAAAWNLAIKKFSSLDITLDREILGSVFGKTMTDIGDILFPSLSETEKDSLLSACCELENNYLKNHPGIIYEGCFDDLGIHSESGIRLQLTDAITGEDLGIYEDSYTTKIAPDESKVIIAQLIFPE